MISDKVSIVIACFNDHLYIEKAIDSALSQTWLNKEIIVVDDGSDAITKKKIKSIEHKIKLLITQENKGVSAARNKGIAAASGEYILILDSDDYFESSFCAKAIKEFKNNTRLKAVTSYARWFKNNKEYQIFQPQGGDLRNFLFRNCSLGTMFRKDDWQKAGGYDVKMEKGFEDWEFYIRLHQNGGKTFVIQEVLFNYRKKKFSKTTIANKNKYVLQEYIFLKHEKIYVANYDLMIKYFISQLEKEKGCNFKTLNSIDYRLGKFILKPVRDFKNILKH